MLYNPINTTLSVKCYHLFYTKKVFKRFHIFKIDQLINNNNLTMIQYDGKFAMYSIF